MTRNSNIYTPDGDGDRDAELDLRPGNARANLGTGIFGVEALETRTTFDSGGTDQGFIDAVQTLDNTASITYVFTNERSNAAGNMYIGQSINGIRDRYNSTARIGGGLAALIDDEHSFEVTIYQSAWPEVLEAFWIQYFWQQASHGGLTNIRQ